VEDLRKEVVWVRTPIPYCDEIEDIMFVRYDSFIGPSFIKIEKKAM
jgi:hypothetical protein